MMGRRMAARDDVGIGPDAGGARGCVGVTASRRADGGRSVGGCVPQAVAVACLGRGVRRPEDLLAEQDPQLRLPTPGTGTPGQVARSTAHPPPGLLAPTTSDKGLTFLASITDGGRAVLAWSWKIHGDSERRDWAIEAVKCCIAMAPTLLCRLGRPRRDGPTRPVGCSSRPSRACPSVPAAGPPPPCRRPSGHDADQWHVERAGAAADGPGSGSGRAVG